VKPSGQVCRSAPRHRPKSPAHRSVISRDTWDITGSVRPGCNDQRLCNKFAKDAAVSQSTHVWLIDGEHFVRYINYIRGSRAVEVEGCRKRCVRLQPLAGSPLRPKHPTADDTSAVQHPRRKVLALAVNNKEVVLEEFHLGTQFARSGVGRREEHASASAPGRSRSSS